MFLGDIVEDRQQDDEEVFEACASTQHGDSKEQNPKSSSIPVIPEDPPELEDTVLKDPELRDQLK